jgi:hypothetical protein
MSVTLLVAGRRVAGAQTARVGDRRPHDQLALANRAPKKYAHTALHPRRLPLAQPPACQG